MMEAEKAKAIRRCSIPECCNSVYVRGWCRAHYSRWHRHGDPLGGGITPGTTAKWIEEVAVSFTGNECLTWPFGGAGGGYGRTWIGGEGRLAHRVVCERVHGPQPTSEHEAAHSCGNGHLGCVNPNHLRWATATENQSDRVLHQTDNRGTRAHLAKLDDSDVRRIRANPHGYSPKELASAFDVTPENIRMIQRRKTWAWLDEEEQPE